MFQWFERDHSKLHLPDYRDRISVFLWVILATLAVGIFLQLPARTLTWTIFGSPLTLDVNTSTLLGIPLVILATSGMAAIIRAHPRYLRGELRHTWILWALPSAVVLTAAMLLPVLPTRVTWLGGLAITGVVLAVVSIAIYHTIDEDDPAYRVARLLLNLATYVIALLLFLLVYQTRTRSLFSGTVTVLIATLLAVEILRSGGHVRLRQVVQYGLLCGLILGEITWALNYWRLPGLTGGLVLLVSFYLVVGLAQQDLAGTLRRQVVIEFLVIAGIALALIVIFAPR